MLKLPSAPEEVAICVTDSCNLSCIHCAAFDTHNQNKELSTQQWFEIIKQLKEMKVFSICVSGGEPFIRKDIFEILDYLEKNPLRFYITTNGTLLDKDKVERLAKYRRLDHIQVSIDGATKESFEYIRGKGSFSRAMNGLKLLLNSPIKTVSYMVATNYNLEDVPKTIELLKEMGVRSLNVAPVLPIGNALCNFKKINLTTAQLHQLEEILNRYRNKYPNFISSSFLDWAKRYGRVKEMMQEDSPEETSEPQCLASCPGYINKITIRADGKVLSCARLWNLVMGDALTEDLKDIWINSKTWNEFRRRCEYKINDLNTCQDCRYTAYCTGGCPAIPYAMTGEIFARDFQSCFRIYSGEENFDFIKAD